ncbi:retrovirus-related pol polyprotein from transposon TNT 1-94 [Tanacetum coccineum]
METTAARVWSKLETLYMTKSLASKFYLKKLYTFYMLAGRKISEHIDVFNKIILDLENIEVTFKDEDLALLLLTSLPSSYEHFVDTLLYGHEALTLEDVMATLNSKEIIERSKAKGDNGEGLYARGRTNRRDHWKTNCPENNHKKSTSYVKKDDYPISSGSIFDDFEGMMVMSAEECDGGSVLLGDNNKCKIRGIGKKLDITRNSLKRGIYRKNAVGQSQGELNANVEGKDSLAQVWHKRLGHISEAGLQVLEKQGLFGKKSLGGWVYILKFKHKAFRKFKEWKLLVENQTGRTTRRTAKKLRTDNGLEFCNWEFEQLCIESGIARHLTVAGTPLQNGVAERINRTLMDKVRCLLIQSGLSKTFWAEATCTAAYLINRSP